MFKKFQGKSEVSRSTLLKSSAQRAVRRRILDDMPDSVVSGQSTANESLMLTANESLTPTDAEALAVAKEALLDEIIPKKATLMQLKVPNECTLICAETGDGHALFFTHFDSCFIPTLRTVHLFPYLLPTVRVDPGAIKFILSGADIMCPGLTHPLGSVDPSLSKDSFVTVTVYGKQHAIAIGRMLMSGSEVYVWKIL